MRRVTTMQGMLAVVLVVLVASCGSGGGTSTVATGPPTPSVSPSATASAQPSIQIAPIPEGTYESEVTRKDAVRFGVTTCAPADITENTGHFTFTFKGGRFREVQSAAHPIGNPLFTGIYSGTRHVMSLIYDTNAEPAIDRLRWSFDGKGLRFKVLSVVPDDSTHAHLCVARMIYEAHKWVKTA